MPVVSPEVCTPIIDLSEEAPITIGEVGSPITTTQPPPDPPSLLLDNTDAGSSQYADPVTSYPSTPLTDTSYHTPPEDTSDFPAAPAALWPGAEPEAARRGAAELVPVGVVGDGNCLFRSISKARFGSEIQHHSVRKEIIKYVVDHWQDDLSVFAVDARGQPFPSLRAYLRQRASPGDYCGALEVLAASRLYGVRLVIHGPVDTIPFEPPEESDHGPAERGDRGARSVHLRFRGSQAAGHYDLLVPPGSHLAPHLPPPRHATPRASTSAAQGESI